MQFLDFFPHSAPERGSDRIFPIIPNEIHLHIFEHISPRFRRLNNDELRTLARLSAVCRFYANICFPRIYEYIEYSGSILSGESSGISSGTTLLLQIAANQPLALSLAKCVRSCHFRNGPGRLEYLFGFGPDVLEKESTPKEYMVTVSQMTNIRELKFSCDLVGEDHWQTIVSLESLEELCFDGCTFLGNPQALDTQQSIKLHIHRLQVIACDGDFRHVAAIDAPLLRAVATDDSNAYDIDWTSRSTFTEFSLYLWNTAPFADEWLTHEVLERVPQTVEMLSLSIGLNHNYDSVPMDYMFDDLESVFDGLEDIFTAPAWNSNLRSVRSLTLQFERTFTIPDSKVLLVVLDGISRLTYLRSCVLRDHEYSPAGMPKMLPSELRAALHTKLGLHSRLTDIDCFGIILHLVEGEWSEVGNR